ncbi:hypothetical protein BRD01_02910 [Halobacteriales archaeon QS_8_65_32]|nr:MAG: hypothetical protein BRD01_02910 [Halobacteriales archaeon QS_8_65_32]
MDHLRARAAGNGYRRSLNARTKTVPAGWYRQVTAAFEASRRLQRAVTGVVGSFVRAGGYDEPAAVRLDVRTEQARRRASDLFADVLRELSTSVDGSVDIDLDVETTGGWPPRGGSGDDDGDPAFRRVERPTDGRVSGGVACATDSGIGTLAPAMYDRDGEPFFATANHVFGARGTKRYAHFGQELSLRHENGETAIGTVARGNPETDLVRVRPSNGYAPHSGIRARPPAPVTGQFTQIGLADFQARNEPLTVMGARSGQRTGTIDGENGITSYYGDIPKRGQLKWGGRFTMSDGDSGSVNYHPDPKTTNGVLIGGFNDARTWWPGDTYVWGTAAYQLRRRYGYHF